MTTAFGTSRAQWALTWCLYLVVAGAMFGRALSDFFLSDDFMFLWAVRQSSTLAWPADLPGHLLRPVIMAAWSLEWHLWGVNPIGFHATSLAIHVLNGGLVTAIAARLTRDRPAGVAAGLIFLCFSGHVEPVAWISGQTDLIGTAFSLACLLAVLRCDARGRGMILAYAACALALLSKESMIAAPIIACGATLLARSDRGRWWHVAGFLGVIGVYLAARSLVLGHAIGSYDGFIVSSVAREPRVRMYLYRSFWPAAAAASVWPRALDLVGLVALFGAATWLAYQRRFAAAFSLCALLVTIVPVLPLSLALSGTASERFVYLPSASSAMLLALLALSPRGLVGRRVGMVAVAFVCACHLATVGPALRAFAGAATTAQLSLSGYADIVAREPVEKTFLLNMPDTFEGVPVFRNGLREALNIFYPAVSDRFVLPVSSARVGPGVRPHLRLESTGVGLEGAADEFAFIGDSVLYRVVDQNPQRFLVRFDPVIDRALLLYWVDPQWKSAGMVEGPGVPTGSVDIPDEGSVCAKGRIRFSGWALMNTRLGRVRVWRDAGSGGPDGPGAEHDAVWLPSTARPDVAAAFRGFPNAGAAGWEYFVPCERADAESVRFHVSVEDAAGRVAEIGTRTIRGRVR